MSKAIAWGALALLFCLPALGAAQARGGQIAVTQETVRPEGGMADGGALLDAYLRAQLGGAPAQRSVGGQSAGAQLTGDMKLAYDALVPFLQAVASGARTSAQIAIGEDVTASVNGVDTFFDAEVELSFTEPRSRFDTGALMRALMADYPYEMYWFDKTGGMRCRIVSGSRLLHVAFSFTVAQDYRGGDLYTADAARTGAAVRAADAARAVVSRYAGLSDLDKLKAYRDEILRAVRYDEAAAEAGVPYGDPWQIIHVFDGDPATNVVCEGYAKAFQHLCDISAFDAPIACYTVSGTMGVAPMGGAQAHMWNIVTMDDGQNYLVDLTNSDSGMVGEGGGLFLAGAAAGSAATYYDISTASGYTLRYAYDASTPWGAGVLTLAAHDYGAQPPVPPAESLPQTGDGSRAGLWLALGLLGAAGLGASKRRRRCR